MNALLEFLRAAAPWVALGAALGDDHTGIGTSLGMLIGLAVGMCIPKESTVFKGLHRVGI